MSGQDRMVAKVIREETIAPAGHFAAELQKNQVLRIVDVEGHSPTRRARKPLRAVIYEYRPQ